MQNLPLVNQNIPIADIHMHCIPGVDDGSVDMEMSLTLLRMDYDQGVRTVFCTSHDTGYDPVTKIGEPFEAYKQLKEICAKEFPDLKMYLGSELLCIPYFMEETIERLQSGAYPTMNGKEYVLVEFPVWGINFDEITYCLEKFADHGYKVIIAHPERYINVVDGIHAVREFKAMNCMLQMNSYSVIQDRNPGIVDLANAMLEERLIDFFGSDAHRTTHRPPAVDVAVETIIKKYGREYAEEILWKNAQSILV